MEVAKLVGILPPRGRAWPGEAGPRAPRAKSVEGANMRRVLCAAVIAAVCWAVVRKWLEVFMRTSKQAS